MQHAGHLALSKVLDSPYVDFIASPYDYENRNVDGVNFPQTVPETIALHGKIHFSEVDLKTFLTDPASKWHHKENWRPQTLQETVEMLKRDYSYAHAMGFGMWWTDLAGKGWYHHEGITQALRKLQEIEERLLESDRSSNREIAVILDEKSLIYERPCQNMMTSLRNVFRQWELAYIGAPFDTYLQSDLIDQELKDYRMYLFLNNVHMTKHEMEVIKECVRRDRKVALWVWAPGLIIDSDLALNHIQDLTEIRVDCENCEARLHVDVVNYDHPITRELPKGSSFGPEISRWHMALFKESGFVEDDPSFTMGPIFYSNDPDVKVLGSLPAVKKPGFVVKELEDWTSIYVSAPMISKAILRNIAKFAGVHVYVESGDLVYANKHFLAVYPRIGGHKVVHLPEPRRITDLWNDELIAEKTDEFEAKMNANTAYMYLLE